MSVRWFCAILIAVATALTVGLFAWLLSPVAPLVSAAVFGATALPFGAALGWIICVAPTTSDTAYTSGDSIESTWTTTAMSGVATDLICILGITLAVVSIAGVEPPVTLLLTALLLAAFASFTTRYALQRHRALSS